MMKKIISLCMAALLCISLFAGCGETVPPQPSPEASPETEPSPEASPTAEPEPEIEGTPFSFTRENMPRMDGSTSLVPLAQAAASLLLGESREDTEGLTQFNRTSQSYRNLMWDQCDILIASWPALSIFEELAAESFAYEMEPIATDALIFVVNENNPVDNLSTEDIIGIYSGEITNWNQVGGADEPIAAFQRNSGAGSQALMEKLVMGDTPMMTPPTELMAGSMGELMEYVKSYDNSATAIGYSVYYYANDMRMAEGLKIIAVDGVEPTADTIRAGEYPHLSNYYTVIGADEAADSPARVMFEWLQSAEGQRLVEQEGYVPVMDLSDAPQKTATEGGFVVKTDWSALSGAVEPEAKFTRLSEEWIDGLAPGDDYGAIYPFVGRVNYNEWGSENVYGLFDQNGRIICDPVYMDVSCCSYYDGGAEYATPMLKLGRTEGAAVAYTLASRDGSFVSPQSYFMIRVFDFGVLCSPNSESSEFTLYDFEGNVLMTEADLKLGSLQLERASEIYDGLDGYLLAWLSDGAGAEAYLISPQGEVLCGGWYTADFMGENAICAYMDGGGSSAGIVNFQNEWVVAHRYNYIESFEGGYWTRRGDKTEVFDLQGNLLAEGRESSNLLRCGYYMDGICYPHNGNSFELEEGWERVSYFGDCPVLCKWAEDGVTVMNVYDPENTIFIPGVGNGFSSTLLIGNMMGPDSSLPYFIIWSGETGTPAKLISWDLKERYEFPEASDGMGAFAAIRDDFTCEEYIRIHYEDGTAELYTSDMEPYAEKGTWTGIWNGAMMKLDESFFSCIDNSGEVLFCYPLIPGSGD